MGVGEKWRVFSLCLRPTVSSVSERNTVKPWFMSIIRSGTMLVIQSTCILKRVSRTVGSVAIMWHLSSRATCITRHWSFIKLNFFWKCLLVLQNTHRTSYLQCKVLLYIYRPLKMDFQFSSIHWWFICILDFSKRLIASFRFLQDHCECHIFFPYHF